MSQPMLAPAAGGLDADLQPMLESLTASLTTPPASVPYQHWLLPNMLPDAVAKALSLLPFTAPDLHGISGKRELHNDTRQYFDAANNARFPVCGALARFFQAPQTVQTLQTATGADLSDTNIRI